MQERLQAERNYTRAVIDTASSMIVLTRLDGTVIAANPATTALTGFTEEDLVGQPLWALLMSGRQQELSAAAFANPSRAEAAVRCSCRPRTVANGRSSSRAPRTVSARTRP